MAKVFNVGLIGCGHIAETYFRAHKYFNNFKITKCADINQNAANKCAKINKIKAVTIKELLSDTDIKIILNLTIPAAHYEVAKQALFLFVTLGGLVYLTFATNIFNTTFN